MTKEDKQLLVQDLSARLPYGVKILFNNSHIFTLHQMNPNEDAGKDGYGIIFDFGRTYSINDCKPYLRPMSSMTEEEKAEYCDLQDKFLLSSQYPVNYGYALFDWLNRNHFDYRGLIPKGLAIEVTEDNNHYKE